MRVLSLRARNVGKWFREQASHCPNGYGMSLNFAPTDVLDMHKLVTAALLWDQRTKARRKGKSST